MNSEALKKLRNWFSKNAATLPWRTADLDEPRDPYMVWISETMLQQTQVATVRDYFIRWMVRFPDIETLAQADETEVFKYWQGLGYYNRARNILKAAKAVCETQKKTLPDTRDELEALPGIGAYTAGAILSLAFHKREAILDGNLVRIFSRFYELDFLPTEKNGAETYWNYAKEVVQSPKAYMHNEALMELGRTVCKIKNPQCSGCPLAAGCRAFADKRTAEFPPSKRRLQKNWHGMALAIESADGKILAVRGGQKFFANQFALPHFETSKSETIGVNFKAERYIDTDAIAFWEYAGTFSHNITTHKIECDVMHIVLYLPAKKIHAPIFADEFSWIEKAKATEVFANSFSLKALRFISKHSKKS